MVGRAILNQLKNDNKIDILIRTRKELDLRDQNSVDEFLEKKSQTRLF